MEPPISWPQSFRVLVTFSDCLSSHAGTRGSSGAATAYELWMAAKLPAEICESTTASTLTWGRDEGATEYGFSLQDLATAHRTVIQVPPVANGQ